MLKRTDVREIEKTLKINNCSIQNMAGAYVDKDKLIVCRTNQKFLAMPEELLFKYLGIVKKLYGKHVDDNVLSTPFAGHRYADDSKLLLGMLLESKLRDETALETFYERIIDEYEYEGNYLILLWYDVYDIPGKGTDGADQDESEEIYEHIMCAICKVELTAAGLSYNPKKNEFTVRERDWVVDFPSCGFVYPSFEERTAEYDKIMFYTSKPANAPHVFMERCLGMEPVRTISEIRRDFGFVLSRALGSMHDAQYWLPHIAKQIYLAYEDNEETLLQPDELETFCSRAGMGEINAQDIRNEYIKEFAPKYPKTAYFLNKSAIKDIEELIKKQEIQSIFRKAAVALEQAAGESELTEQLHTLADGK